MIRRHAVFLFLYIAFLSSVCEASELQYRQVTTILKFYDALSEDTPTVERFFELFGKDNEAELELILRKDFPLLDIESDWFKDQKAKAIIDEVYKNPNIYPSKFLTCIRVKEPLLFSVKEYKLLEFPPQTSKDFRTYSVRSDRGKVGFEFSQDEYTIENVYMPDGTSIYTLIQWCTGH